MSLRYGSIALALLLIGSFLVPSEKLFGPLDFGARGGGNAAFMANFAKSYHHDNWQFKSGLPATYRSPDGTAAPEDLYCSQIPYIYITYAIWTRIFGLSPTALRSLALLFCMAGAFLVWRLLWPTSRAAAVVALLLYATAPLTLEYGLMPESTMPEGVALLAALWGYQQYAAGKQRLLHLFLLCTPILLCASHVSAFLIASLFVTHWVIKGNLKDALRLSLLLALPWAILLAIHLGMIYDATGSLDAFFNRAGARGFSAALRMGRNPFLTVLRHWQERLGIPLCFFLLVGFFRAWRNRKSDPYPVAPWLAMFGVFVCLHTALLEWMAQHRYALQILFPTMVWLAAPGFVSWLTGRKWQKTLAVLLILVCAGMFIRKHRQWKPADPEAVHFGTSAQILGHNLPPEGRIALLLPRTRFASYMMAQYYAGRKVTIFTPEALQGLQSGKWDGFLAIDIDLTAPEINSVLPAPIQRIQTRGRSSLGYASDQVQDPIP